MTSLGEKIGWSIVLPIAVYMTAIQSIVGGILCATAAIFILVGILGERHDVF